ncbi:GTPase [Actinoplanes sp. NBRC 103695]|uniref:GTPase n=1 Tax=Actinoplanes sp. NBRC 103695 TaxID=3032202 RepID=UPI0024A04A73|nr:GTPase [Actinoplanes sp. NBRC 103695]GLY94353.1 isoniazid inducible gene protein IniA [Actinoplanes sp. NBRC 103695]
MTSWEAGPTAYAGPTSLVPLSRAVPDPLRAAAPLSWLDVMDATIRTCSAHGRAEIANWLSRRRTRMLEPQLRVLVAGAARQGKSQLINAMINATVCGVPDHGGTTVPAVIRHADIPEAQLIRRDSPSADWTGDAGLRDRIPLAVDGLDRAITQAAATLPATAPLHADIGVPRTLLARGLVLIDTPPLTGLPGSEADAVAEARELTTGAGADLVLFTCETGRDLSDAELAVLADLSRLFPALLVVLTKADYSPDWRQHLARSREQLTHAGVPATVAAVSSSLRLHAVKAGDAGLNTESGFPDLILHLQRMLAAKPDQLAPAMAAVLSRTVLERLAKPLRAELTAEQAGDATEAVARLHATQRRLDDLRRCAQRWQNRLSDEVGDLMSDIEHDLRERTRAVLTEADEFFTTADPAKEWDEFEPWLRDAVEELTRASVTWLAERAQWMARKVADEFPADAGDVLPAQMLAVPDDFGGNAGGLDAPPVASFSPGQKLFIGLKGSYGGVIMFGLATSLAGMSLINPISIGGGALFGSKSIRDEGKALLKRRQAEARTIVQRHVDEIFVRLTKDARDTVRRIQRSLRDHFTAVTEDLQEAVMESLRSAKAAADREVAVREQRARGIQQELAQLSALNQQAQALRGGPSPAALAGSAAS